MKPTNDNGNHDETNNPRVEASAAASTMRDVAGDAAHELKERLGAIAGDLKETAAGWQKELEEYVRKNPTKSILTAVGVGFVLGVICRR